MSLVALLIYAIVIAIIVGLLLYVVSLLPIDPAIKNFARIAVLVICAIFLIIWLVSILGGIGGGPVIGPVHVR